MPVASPQDLPIQIQTPAPPPASAVDVAALRRDFEGRLEGEVRFDLVARGALFYRCQRVPDPAGGRGDSQEPRRYSAHARDLPAAPLPDHHARRRHLAGRAGGGSRHADRHLQILSPGPGGQRRERWARVEPGIVLDELNAQVARWAFALRPISLPPAAPLWAE